MVEKDRYLVFQIDDRFFAIDIERVTKVIKEKKDTLKITEIEHAPRHVIGIAEVEISQNEKKLITFIDFKSLSAVIAFLQEYDEHDTLRNKATEDTKPKTDNAERKTDSEEDSQRFQEPLRKRIFVIISHPEKESHIGILVNKVEGISDFIEGRNAYFYPVPNIKGVKDLFANVIIPHDRERKIFTIRTEKIFEVSGVE